MATTHQRHTRARLGAQTAQPLRRRGSLLAELYRSAVGKKYAMAISGLVLMVYVLLHLAGNLKLYAGAESMNAYAAWLRVMGEPVLPEGGALWAVRVILIVAVIVHIAAAAQLTAMNRADFASRTMRWSGVIVGLFIVYHLADLTFGWLNPNPDFAHGSTAYGNVVASFSNPVVAGLYIVANLALGLHLYHGAWSLFQSMGWSNPAVKPWRRGFAIAFAVVVAAGNISFPIAVLTGAVA
ncbi:MAG: succinate dehydrogenase [Actinobacteria bacterium QS_8_72_14]|nr:MAG: succinate dehydrogenase [Actinobacteria bacterium QS_8_72_14]